MEADSLLLTLLDQDNETQEPGQENSNTQEPTTEQTQPPKTTQSQTQSQSLLSPSVDAPSMKKQKTTRGKGRQKGNTTPLPATPGPPTAQTNTASKGKGKGRKRRHSESEGKSENDCIVAAINRLTEQIGGLSKRIERMESSLDTKIAKHVQKALNPAIDKIKEEFNAEIKKVREEMELLKGNQTYHQIEQDNAQDTYLNIVIRNLPESANENAKTKVNSFLKEALKVDVILDNVERKPAKSELENGVIIATCKNRDDKSKTS